MENDKLRSLIAPTVEERTRRLEIFKQYAIYGIIVLILLITVFIIPIIAGGVTAEGWDYWIPQSKFGWFCWWAMKIGTVVGNLAVFGLFKVQAKINSQHNPNYLKAKELLNTKTGQEGFIPSSPTKYQAKTWGLKGSLTMILTAAETIVIGSLVIAWDLVTFISCITSGFTAVIFGIIQMIKDEVYWTDEYLQYAEYMTQKKETVEETVVQQEAEKELE